MSNDAWPNRLYTLDVSRGFAALSVVLWHWQHFGYRGHSLDHGFLRESQPLYEILRLFYEKGIAGVQYFFLLSGFIFFWLYRESIQNKETSAETFVVLRFSRLYPLHLVTLLVVAVLQLHYISREGISFVYPFNDAYHFFLNLGFASNWGFESGWSFNAPVWSVSIEVLLYIIFFLVAFFRQGGWLFSLSVSIVSFVLAQVINHKIFNGLALFFLGGFVFHLTFFISTRNQLMKGVVYLVAIISWSFVITNFYFFELSGIVLKFGKAGNLFLIAFPNYILFASTVCSLALLEVDNGAFVKPISWAGDITYSLYLLHFPINLSLALAVSYGILSSKFYVNPLYLLFYFMVLIPMSYIVYKKFERPMQEMLRKQTIDLKKP
jgi:peptidoglycan/LPS O-acetylase OafA/YrhL